MIRPGTLEREPPHRLAVAPDGIASVGGHVVRASAAVDRVVASAVDRVEEVVVFVAVEVIAARTAVDLVPAVAAVHLVGAPEPVEVVIATPAVDGVGDVCPNEHVVPAVAIYVRL